MNKDELKTYFINANYLERSANGSSEVSRYSLLFFEHHNDEGDFVIDYYDSSQAIIETHKLKQTDKPYVISIADFDYPLAQSAL